MAGPEQDYRRAVKQVGSTHFLTGSSVEVIHQFDWKQPPSQLVFDVIPDFQDWRPLMNCPSNPGEEND